MGPILDHGDPQRQSYAYSQERRPRMFDNAGVGGDGINSGQTTEASLQFLPAHQIQNNGGEVPAFISSAQQ